MQKPLLIRVEWDDAAAVWSADSDDIPGLATEAATVEALAGKLKQMIPELLSLNGIHLPGDIGYELLIRRFDSVSANAA
jgi:predicted RNase H-like HicB family nuclease